MTLAQPHIGMQIFGIKAVSICLLLSIEHELAELVGKHEVALPVFKYRGLEQES